MHFGHTSLRLAGVLAKGLHRPKLRTDMRMSRQIIAGEVSYIFKIPETENYVRFGEYAYDLLQLCDGTRTPAELAAAITEKHPEEPIAEAEVVEWVQETDPNIWERSLGEKNLAILEKIRDERKQRVDRSSLLYITFSAWDPDVILDRLDPYLKWMFTRGFVIFSACLFALTALIVASDWTRIRQDTVEFYNFSHKSAYDLWIFWVLLFFISGVHEFGHGLTCKHFGGEVHNMGLMLMYFTPSFYTDCTDMYMFDQGSKRLWTIFAGIWIELVMCALATLVWFYSAPGSFVGDLGYKTLLLTGVSGVIINLNPLMKFDGYFALSQYLEIESLREDAFEYLKAWLQRVVLRRPVDLPSVSRKRARIFLTFGISAFLYSTFLLWIVTIFLKNVFTSRFGDWGYLLAALALYFMMRKRLQRWLPGMVSAWKKSKETYMAWKMTRWQMVGALGLGVLLVVPPLSTQVSTEFVLEPGQKTEVRATVPGLVSEVRAWEEAPVAAGAELAVLKNPEIEAQHTVVTRERELAERTMLAARGGSDLGEIQRQNDQLRRLLVEQARAKERREGLVLRAPLSGVVTTPQLEQRVGEYLAEGATFATVVDRSRMKARILVRDWELEDVSVGARVKLQVRAYPWHTFTGTVEQILPAAALDRPVAEPEKIERKGQELSNYMAVVLEFPNQEGLLREGMTGTAKISGSRSPLAWKAARGAWRWLRSHLW